MNLWNETKSIPISRQMIWEAYKKVRANKGSAGIDNVSMEEFDANRAKYLYKLWNKRYKTSIKRAYKWLARVQEQYSYLFYHWQLGFVY